MANNVPINEVTAVAKAMKVYGGSFVKALGEALLRADPYNVHKIYTTWPELWKEYKSASERMPSEDY